MTISPWRERLQPASLNGVEFHVDVQARASGRRIALHEFPKKDLPYPEDMARKARRFAITGYVIGPDYTADRDDLVQVLEAEGPCQLQLPTELNQDVMQVVVDQFSVTERRERGGYAEFEMSFIEAGSNDFTQAQADTQTQSNNAAQNLISQSQASAVDELTPSDI
jgi:prophage DNA circulation protein